MKMMTDEEKTKIGKLLEGLEVPEVKLTERCSDIVKEFHIRFDKEIDEENQEEEASIMMNDNPYRVDPRLLEENERKLKELLSKTKRVKKDDPEPVVTNSADPKRPWRTHSNKEKLLRIDNDIKRHIEKSREMTAPLNDGDLKNLVRECREETFDAPLVRTDRLRETVEAAKKNLPNFQYRKIENSTATAITAAMQEGDKNVEEYKELVKSE